MEVLLVLSVALTAFFAAMALIGFGWLLRELLPPPAAGAGERR